MKQIFRQVFPGDGAWMVLDVNSCVEAARDLTSINREEITNKVESIGRAAWDWGLPYFVILPSINLPLSILSLTYAPFMPITQENMPIILNHIPNSQTHPFDPRIGSRTNCWLSSFDSATSEWMTQILDQRPYQVVLFGLDKSGFIQVLMGFLSTARVRTWVVEDLVCAHLFPKLAHHPDRTLSNEFIEIYRSLNGTPSISK